MDVVVLIYVSILALISLFVLVFLIFNAIKGDKKPAVILTGKKHFASRNMWGSAVHYNRCANGTAKISGHKGWSDPAKNGDICVFDAKDGFTYEFVIFNVQYERDPVDMFFADCYLHNKTQTIHSSQR